MNRHGSDSHVLHNNADCCNRRHYIRFSGLGWPITSWQGLHTFLRWLCHRRHVRSSHLKCLSSASYILIGIDLLIPRLELRARQSLILIYNAKRNSDNIIIQPGPPRCRIYMCDCLNGMKQAEQESSQRSHRNV